MYPSRQAVLHANKPAFIMASTGETVTYGELEQRSNRLAAAVDMGHLPAIHSGPIGTLSLLPAATPATT